MQLARSFRLATREGTTTCQALQAGPGPAGPGTHVNAGQNSVIAGGISVLRAAAS